MDHRRPKRSRLWVYRPRSAGTKGPEGSSHGRASNVCVVPFWRVRPEARGADRASGGGRAGGRRGNNALRVLDARLGPLILRLLGLRRRARPRPTHPQRIGIMKTTGIGDMVLASAVARDMQEAFAEARIVVLAGPGNTGVARLIEGADVVSLPTARPWRAIPMIRAADLDVLIDLGQWTRLEALYTALSGAPWTAGFQTRGFDRHFAYDATVEHSDRVAELENYRELVRTAGGAPGDVPRFRYA